MAHGTSWVRDEKRIHQLFLYATQEVIDDIIRIGLSWLLCRSREKQFILQERQLSTTLSLKF